MAIIRLLVVDDFRLWRDCVQAHFEGHPDSVPEIVRGALKAGGSGYVHKEDASAELLSSLESVLAGKQYLSQSVSDLVDVT